ncbi:MAG: hypothetical protein ACQEVA_16460 [Myxococcota bacterium]
MCSKIILIAAISVSMTLVGCGGCESEEATDESSKQAQQDQDGATDEDEKDMAKNREAYGLPLPPQVSSVRRDSDQVRVVTTMTLDELAEFYESRLQDYEVLRPPQRIEVLGLRSYMPEVQGHRFAGTVRLLYTYERDPDSDEASAEEGDDGKAGSLDEAQAKKEQTRPLHKRKRGEPVMDRTSDGELLAPGAKWGEPYTPPPGSPLHKDRYKSNWGKPYGEWVSQ